MPWNYGFFIGFFIRREIGEKAQGQVNQGIGRLNGKENGEEKWIKTLLKPSPLTLNPNRTLFSFFEVKIKKYKYFERQVQGKRV